MNLEKLQEIKTLNDNCTKTEYNNALKVFKKAINKLTLKTYKSNPAYILNEFELILNEGVRIRVITDEYKKEKLKHLQKELNTPSKFKQDVKCFLLKNKEKIQKQIDKLRNKDKNKEYDIK